MSESSPKRGQRRLTRTYVRFATLICRSESPTPAASTNMPPGPGNSPTIGEMTMSAGPRTTRCRRARPIRRGDDCPRASFILARTETMRCDHHVHLSGANSACGRPCAFGPPEGHAVACCRIRFRAMRNRACRGWIASFCGRMLRPILNSPCSPSDSRNPGASRKACKLRYSNTIIRHPLAASALPLFHTETRCTEWICWPC